MLVQAAMGLMQAPLWRPQPPWWCSSLLPVPPLFCCYCCCSWLILCPAPAAAAQLLQHPNTATQAQLFTVRHTCEFVLTLVVSTDRGPVRNSSASFASRSSTDMGAAAMAADLEGRRVRGGYRLVLRRRRGGRTTDVISASCCCCLFVCLPHLPTLQ